MRLILAIIVGKVIAFLTKILNLGGGSAAPGLYALKIEPKLVEKLVVKIPKNIVITGTNGKTTTSRMIAEFGKESGLRVIRNHTGSNLERGIASALIANYQPFTISKASLRVNHKLSLGIWELDEAAFNSVAPKIKPNIVVFLNVFRDQLDRYGEVDTVVKKWIGTLDKLSKDTLILVNGDDTNTLKLKNHFEGKVEIFGVDKYKIEGESPLNKANQLNFEAKKIKLNGLSGSTFQLTVSGISLTVNLPLPGIYHIYDAIAALATVSHLFPDLPIYQYTDTLKNFQPAFGRFEKLSFGAIFLIKNPVGATQVFETLASQIQPSDRLLLALNDNLADGTDVSWIWDAEFEKLCQTSSGRGTFVTVSGSRAYDLAVRLKYAGFKPNQITVAPSLEKALQEARSGLQGQLYILPTYTAMLAIQEILAKIGVKPRYWEEG